MTPRWSHAEITLALSAALLVLGMCWWGLR